MCIRDSIGGIDNNWENYRLAELKYVEPVSYKHLDVYKRQRLEAIFECSEINYRLMRYLFIILFFTSLMATAQKNTEADIYSLEQFQQRVLQDNDTVYVVNFWATWCGPCAVSYTHLNSPTACCHGSRTTRFACSPTQLAP